MYVSVGRMHGFGMYWRVRLGSCILSWEQQIKELKLFNSMSQRLKPEKKNCVWKSDGLQLLSGLFFRVYRQTKFLRNSTCCQVKNAPLGGHARLCILSQHLDVSVCTNAWISWNGNRRKNEYFDSRRWQTKAHRIRTERDFPCESSIVSRTCSSNLLASQFCWRW